MKLDTLPHDCCAVVVGIERYEAGKTLHGPASDAMRFVAWLLARGVRPEAIRVFLSVAPDREPAPVEGLALEGGEGARELVRTRDGARIKVWPATQDAIRSALIDPAWAPASRALILFWGGHGALGDLDDQRYLYTCDARAGDEKGIDLAAQLNYLRTTRFNRWQRQIAIVDACATLISARRVAVSTQSLPERDPVRNPRIGQLVMYATAPGEFAANIAAESTGAFSKAMFETFAGGGADALPTSASGWPDFGVLGERLIAKFKDSKQRPVIRIHDENGPRGSLGELPRDRAREEALVEVLRAFECTDLGVLQRAFRHATRHVEAITVPASSAEIVQALGAFPVPIEGGLKALDLFAVNLHGRCVRLAGNAASAPEREAYERDAAAVLAWLTAQVSDKPALRGALKRELAPAPAVAHLLLAVPANLAPAGVRAWLYCRGASMKSWPEANTPPAANLDAALGEAVCWAEQLVDEAIVVELLLPRPLLASELDRHALKLPAEAGITDRALGSDYPVVLRFRERVLGESRLHLKAYRLLAPKVLDGFRLGGPYGVKWPGVAPELATAVPDAESPWIAFDRPVPGARSTTHLLDAMLDNGVPLAVWPTDEPVDAKAFRKAVDMLLRDASLEELPVRVQAGAGAFEPRLKVLMDCPERFPAIDGKLQGDAKQRVGT